MSKSQPVTTNTTQTNSIPGWLSGYAQQAAGQGAALPGYTPYGGPNPYAGMTSDQLQALGLASSTAGQGAAIAGSAQNPLTALTGYQAPQVNAASLGSQVQGLLNPATQDVINTTNAQLQKQTTQGINQEDNNLAAQHAFGGTRQGVADAVQQNQGNMTMASTDASLNQGNYNTALATALSAQQGNQSAANQAANTQLGAASALGGLGSTISGINAQDLSGLLNAGGVAQSTATNQGGFNYQQYLNSMQLPDQQAQAFASILGSLPHDTTSNGTQTSNVYSNVGLGAAGLGLGLAGLGTGGGTTLGGSALSGLGSAAKGGLAFLSDRRLKKDVRMIGLLGDGQPVYRWRYDVPGHDQKVHVGLMAQDVEKRHPEAVHEVGGVKFVDYGKATAAV